MSLEQNKSTIAAISTPLGGGAVGIVRLSGDKSLEIVKTLSKNSAFIPRYATLTILYDREGEILDEVIVIYFKAPYSYTREDVVEIQCHGGNMMVRRILDEVLYLGVRLAQSGEFTKRAFLNGRLDLSQAQAVAKLIEAKSIQAQKTLLKQLKGELSVFVEQSRESLYEALAYSEVMIDYSEEDIPEDTLDLLNQKIDTLYTRLEKILFHSRSRVGIFEGFSLCIVGKPNVGKSSLLNALLLYDRAIISNIAGTTRDTIEEMLNIGSTQVRLIDTAGIRESDDEIENIGIAKSKEAMEKSDIILVVFDGSKELDDEDEKIIDLLKTQDKKRIISIFNKNDLPQKVRNSLPYPSFCLSAQNKEIDELVSYLQGILQESESDEILLCASNQIQSIEQTLDFLNEAKEMLHKGCLELFSYNIRDAIESLGKITRPYESTDLLDKMFSEFCLGK
ncbi:tRNA uridine-5-carboxymethylaminomethyl(34) synthesis GTPase MnmE [Helicobacter cholecystus]|uniref:tRNA uridine-5-carboxymethylaminomethyl(34) synthesis GTPase MnmE n=1 Tax=Helicobacter cholecystus TaxID=45498 RepID=UPI00273987F3|nr:tRNA uridine-5-carboxymethylaminomethyl(34) synthesis GTPase MnmE [Helicobacter cholecystus]